VLLPLYQGQGEDGFFLCRDVHPLWLRLARWLRRLRLDALLPLLPGVSRHREQPDALLVDPGVARLLVREVFHLFGYRHCRPAAGRLVFTRRRVAPITRQLPWRG
jgi:succinylglutamate desuccinylase